MTNDWSRHVESLKARLSEINETVETIRSSVEARPGLADATHAISSLMNSAESLDQGLARFPGVVSEILENSVLGAVLIGPHGKFLLHNQTAGEILGYQFILNRHDDSLAFIDESGNHLSPDELPWSIALAGESVTDMRLLLKSGAGSGDSEKWITFSATPFTNNDQRDTSTGGAMLFMLDTTEEVVIEESIANICQTISSQIAQVGSTQDQLQELASKLSNTGVQRLLSDRGIPQDAGHEEGDSHLKKSIARHTDPGYTESLSASTEVNTHDEETFDSADDYNHDDNEIFESETEVDQNLDEAIEEYQEVESEFEEKLEEDDEEEHEVYEQETDADHTEEEDPESSSSSPESLFGKMATMTGSTAEQEQNSRDAEEENLPWPEVVDSEDYGQNLWEEYTQNDETTSAAWEEDEHQPEEEPLTEEELHEPEYEEEVGDEVDFEELDELEPRLEHHEEVYEEDADEERSIETEYTQIEETPELEEEFVQEEHLEEEEEEEHTIESEYEEIEEEESPAAEGQQEPEDHREAVKGGKSLRNTLFGKKKRKPRTSGTYAAIGGPNELDASYMDDDEENNVESMVVDFGTDVVEEKPVSNKVLVVDDIPVNQKLLLLHLKRLGYEADVANNGKEALEAMEKEQYQVVLMDCDMPVMNGFEAASKIRATEAYSHRRVPIIALTSYDREGDRDRCIAAGMDDYITKGSSRKELKEAIERSIVSAQEKSKGEPGEGGEEDLHADVEPLDINSMLKLYGQEEVEEISRLFLSNMAAYIECMQLAIDEKDADSVVHFANAVKGPCAALGMKLMTRLTSDIIEIAEKEDWTQVRVKYMRLKAVFVQTQEELKKVCPDDSLISK